MPLKKLDRNRKLATCYGPPGSPAFRQDGIKFDATETEIPAKKPEVKAKSPFAVEEKKTIDVVDKNLDGYINMDEIKKALDKTTKIYHDEMSRTELLALLKEAVDEQELTQCPECPKVFTTVQGVTMHAMRAHKGLGPQK